MGYWIARANWGGDNMADKFIRNSCYEIGNVAYPLVLDYIEQVIIGDVFILATPKRTNTIASIGVVAARISPLSFDMLWFPGYVESPLSNAPYARLSPMNVQGNIDNNINAALVNNVGLQIFINNSIETAKMKKYTDLLKSNKNIILTGAPGTGKTFLAKEIAKQIVETVDCISFVQFHPSYDYTDFVEGLRPIKKDGQTEIGFQLKNGIFKEFCKKALVIFKEDINKEKDDKRKFVFIIDEVNRGEISKIFGELFFAIDPGYRGEKGSIKTQYHNINEKDDFVDIDANGNRCFYIPENVYIIGTMNDIDRSVESFDFAMRRRFAWIEVKPEDRISMLDVLRNELKVEAIAKMTALNTIIKNNENLGSHFQIGPAYFLKLKEANYDFIKLWDYHLEILLREYLRGFSDAKNILVTLKTAYDGAH